MGYIKHNAIVVTGWGKEKMEEARQKAIEIFEDCFKDEPFKSEELYGGTLVSEIVAGLINGYMSFFIAPDGSKEWWETSDNGDRAREKFFDWLRKDEDGYYDYVEIQFGGDDNHENIIRSNNQDYNEF